MMSKTLEEYGDRKSCAVTTAKRLAQFLGDERIKDKGLACNYVVATCAPSRRSAAVSLPSVHRTCAARWQSLQQAGRGLRCVAEA